MKRRTVVITSGLLVILVLVAGVVIYRVVRNHSMLDKYFELGDYSIISRHHAFATFSTMSHTVFNLETPHVSPKPMLSEVRCPPWGNLVPLESVFYKAEYGLRANALTPDKERQQRLPLAGIAMKCYQVTRDLGKGFPEISVYYQQTTGRATIYFPY